MPSTVIAYMNYDESKSLLRVGFVSGMVYEYNNVPVEVYREMKTSGSKGAFLNNRIKGHYPFKKVK